MEICNNSDRSSVSGHIRCNAYNYNKPILVSFHHGENELKLEVKRRLDACEVEYIVTAVSQCVVNPKTGVYRPWLKDYFLRMAVLETYTNLDFPDNFDACWSLVYDTPIFAKLTGNHKRPVTFRDWDYDDNDIIDAEQYEQILMAIEQMIAYAIRFGY